MQTFSDFLHQEQCCHLLFFSISKSALFIHPRASNTIHFHLYISVFLHDLSILPKRNKLWPRINVPRSVFNNMSFYIRVSRNKYLFVCIPAPLNIIAQYFTHRQHNLCSNCAIENNCFKIIISSSKSSFNSFS